MNSARELMRRAGGRSLRALAAAYGVGSVRDTMAAYLIADHHRRTGRAFGPLGAAVGGLVRRADGGYAQSTELGVLELGDVVNENTRSFRTIKVKITLAAVKCFDTDDPGGDELYVVLSVTSIDPNYGGVDKLVFTTRTEIHDDVHDDAVLFEERTLGPEEPLAFPGSGIRIHVAVYDHEHGDADEIRDPIHTVLDDAARKGAQALAGAAAGGDPRMAGAAGDITEFEVGGVEPFKLLTLGMADLIAKAFSDDLIGEHEYVIPASQIVEWAEQDKDTGALPRYEASFRTSPDLPRRVQFNWPPSPEEEHMFSGGGGNYKVYFRIQPIIRVEPGAPPRAG